MDVAIDTSSRYADLFCACCFAISRHWA